MVEAELYRCSPRSSLGGLAEPSALGQAGRSQVLLLQGKVWAYRPEACRGPLVVGSVLASRELLPCELLLPISWPLGHSPRESRVATTLPLRRPRKCALSAGLGSWAYIRRSQVKRSSLVCTAWCGIEGCICL